MNDEPINADLTALADDVRRAKERVVSASAASLQADTEMHVALKSLADARRALRRAAQKIIDA